MRVIERDALPKVAARLVERLAENPGASLDIGAETVSERPVGLLPRRAPVLGDLAEPCVVDLHRADVDGAVRVLTDRAEPPGFDADQEHEHAGGHMMNFGRRLQAPLDHRLIGFRRNADRKPDRQRRERRRCEGSPYDLSRSPFALIPAPIIPSPFWLRCAPSPRRTRAPDRAPSPRERARPSRSPP